MGEANRKREALRKQFLAECDVWGQEPTPEETELVAQIAQLPMRRVHRVAPDQLAYMRMLPQECHQNCFSYVKLDPMKECSVVSGWWKLDGGYVAHSVVQNDSGMFCITPHMHVVTEIDFIPDPTITWQEEADGRIRPFRDGQAVPKVLRENPRKRIAETTILRDRLLSGMDPMKALSEPIDDDLLP